MNKAKSASAPEVLLHLKSDVPAGFVVFLVALPLCMGIALASGAPLISGLITGIIGGLVVPFVSRAPLSVSGPAAGLTVIVLQAISDLGGFENFLAAVVLGGLLQMMLGVLRAGVFGYYIPASVIRGMLAAIGVILIMKQIPHLIGFEGDYIGDDHFAQSDGRNTFSEIPFAIGHLHKGATIIGVISLALLFLADRVRWSQKVRFLPAALIVVMLGVALNIVLPDGMRVTSEHLVSVPAGGFAELAGQLALPNWQALAWSKTWLVAGTIAVIASIETLLCVEAVDKLDTLKRETPTNRELLAQGVGNAVAGVLGGLPMTSVIVRGSANVQAGARTRASAFAHGLFLLVAVVLLPKLLNLIPLASLAAILLHVGYKLAPLSLIRQIWTTARPRASAFVATLGGVLLTDLLMGVAIGTAVYVLFLLRASATTAYAINVDDDEDTVRWHRYITLGEHVPYLAKASLRHALAQVPDGAEVVIDATNTQDLDPDVVEVIHDFATAAPGRNITLELKNIPPPMPLGHG